MDTLPTPTQTDVIHTRWCDMAGNAQLHPDGGDCTRIAQITSDGEIYRITLQGTPFDVQDLNMGELDITAQTNTYLVIPWITRTLTEMSGQMQDQAEWEEWAILHHSPLLDTLQAAV